jgi:hypothetical protein
MAENFADTLREVEYVNNVTHTLRQEPGILYTLAGSTGNYAGRSEAKIEDRFSRLKMQRKTTRNGDTNLTDTSVERRFIKKPGRYNVATLIDRDDIDVTSVDLKSPLIRETASAARTYHDDAFLAGFWGDAWIGAETAQSTVAFPSANKVAHNFGGVSVGLTLAKLIELKRLLRKASVNFSTEKPIILLDADAEADLFNIEKYVSFDYQGSKPLVDGELKPWMGFRFLPANLGDPEAYPESASLFQVGGLNRLPVIVPSGLHRGVWVEFWGKTDPRSDKQYSEQIYAEAESTVTRTDEKKAWFIETKPVS